MTTLILLFKYPTSLSGAELGNVRKTGVERAAVGDDFFVTNLEKMRIMAINARLFVPVDNRTCTR